MEVVVPLQVSTLLPATLGTEQAFRLTIACALQVEEAETQTSGGLVLTSTSREQPTLGKACPLNNMVQNKRSSVFCWQRALLWGYILSILPLEASEEFDEETCASFHSLLMSSMPAGRGCWKWKGR